MHSTSQLTLRCARATRATVPATRPTPHPNLIARPFHSTPAPRTRPTAPVHRALPSDPFAQSTRALSSSSRKNDAGTLLTDHQIPERENEVLSRIERLMKLGDQLSAQSELKGAVPGRLRGSGLYVRDDNAPKMVNVQEGDLEPLPKTRRMGDSYVQMDLRFSEDNTLREQYVGGISQIRMGRLMEDFDSVAGAAAYRYVLPDGVDIADASKYGFYLVTAAVDRIDVLRPVLNADGSIPDLRLSGHVSYATESSLEVFVRLSTVPSGAAGSESETILIGRFAMACRSFQGGKHPIAKLLVEGPEEEEMWKMGKEMREGKKKRSQTSLEKTPPTAEEAAALHELFIQRAPVYDRQAPTPPDVIFMSDTRIKSAQLMHPQERNVHNKIFGGYLMRLAYETAYATACLFARAPVTFVSLDELQFRQPVELGSLLLLDSKVTYSPLEGKHKTFHISVEAATCDLVTGEKKITNTFHWTFASAQPLERHVLPRSYKQAMGWLDAQRRRRVGIEIRKVYTSSAV
ncbi:hypothetical protein JCM10207_004602 [Rhodosporidiobolus poonsookiae]